MLPVAAVPSLVSPRRLGAALHAHRAASQMTVSGLSRHCDGWWGPDDLLEVERGAWTLDDASIVSICHLYALPGRGLPSPGSFDLVLDRSDSTDLADDGPAAGPASTVETGLIRLSAMWRLLGGDPTQGAGRDALVEAFDRPADEIAGQLAWNDGPGVDLVDEVAHALSDRVAVPTVGILIAATPTGSLVLTRRAGGAWRSAVERVAPAGPLRWFTTGSTATASV